MTIVLGLTGSIATGKSTVLSLFADLGALVRSADQTVHTLYAGRAALAVENHFSGTVVNGVVDRVRLAKKLLEEPERFAELEAIIHPMVREETFAFLQNAREQGNKTVVLEIPLLFETGAPYPLDATVVTWCDAGIQRKRALARSGMTVEKLETILARQIGQHEKMLRADYRIDTGGGLKKTRDQVVAVLADCRRKKKKENPA
jgi:dephospho-CoA kinase